MLELEYISDPFTVRTNTTVKLYFLIFFLATKEISKSAEAGEKNRRERSNKRREKNVYLHYYFYNGLQGEKRLRKITPFLLS